MWYRSCLRIDAAVLMAVNRAYDAHTEWTNSLFLDFADCDSTRLMKRWRLEHGISDFPAHATLITVDETRFPPDDKETPLKVAVAVKEVLEELAFTEVAMSIDGLLKFGDYHPYKMRMVQVEAVGNFVGPEFNSNLIVDGGQGRRKLYPPKGSGVNLDADESAEVYAKLTPSQRQLEDYRKLQTLRECLCLKLGPETARATCSDHSKWKPHVSAAYANDGSEALTEKMLIDFQQRLLHLGLAGGLTACSISYWEMRGKTASQWEEKSRVALLSLDIMVL